MNRKEFLRSLGLAGVFGVASTIRPTTNTYAAIPMNEQHCALVPTETAGPFPLDLSDNSEFFRSDVREDVVGVELKLRIRIVGDENCAPIANARVHIWHCDANGIYTGYNTGSNPGDVEATACRGHQYTDQNGEVEFTTVFPSWYTGRICHIHFQVYVSSAYSAVSQFTFPLETKNQLYREHPELYPKGVDPLHFSQDGGFADGHELQLASLVRESNDLYTSLYEATVRGSGTTDVGHYERRRSEYITVDNPFPLPALTELQIPFVLKTTSHVRCRAYDTAGKHIASIVDSVFQPGNHVLTINSGELRRKATTVIFEIEVDTPEGTFKVPRVVSMR